jgi:hypothetical protein
VAVLKAGTGQELRGYACSPSHVPVSGLPLCSAALFVGVVDQMACEAIVLASRSEVAHLRMGNSTDFNIGGLAVGKYQQYAASHTCAGTRRPNLNSGCVEKHVNHHR